MGSRFVVYFEPALANLDGIDNSISTRLESQVEAFLTVWKPEAAFEKRLRSHLHQFKYSPARGSGARAFAAHCQRDQFDIALVLTAYKKTNERKFLAAQNQYNARAKTLVGVLEEKSQSQVTAWIQDQRESDDRRVVGEGNV